MTFTVTDDSNFCRVFEMPTRLPSDYCFGGGHPVSFQMVDWFYPLPRDGFGHDMPSYVNWTDGCCELSLEDAEKVRDALRKFIRPKRYFRAGRQYLVITDYGDSFLVSSCAVPDAA